MKIPSFNLNFSNSGFKGVARRHLPARAALLQGDELANLQDRGLERGREHLQNLHLPPEAVQGGPDVQLGHHQSPRSDNHNQE